MKYTYDGLDRVTKSEQEHDGAVDGGTPAVQYAHAAADGGIFVDGSRLARVEYPNGRYVHYTYGASGGISDRLNRVEAIKNDNGSGSAGATTYAGYTYLGAGRIVKVSHPAVTGGLNLTYGTGGTYGGWDRFGRVTDLKWENDSATLKDRFRYGYDRGSNRTWREIGHQITGRSANREGRTA